MKKEQIEKMIRENIELPEGVDAKDVKLNLEPIHESINGFANNLVKTKSEETYSKAQNEMLEKYGFENQEQLDEAIKNADNKEDKDKLTALSEKVEKLEGDLQEKENVLKQKENAEVLKSLNVREDRIDKAMKLIGEGDDETPFKDKAESFVKETPEWLVQKEEKTRPRILGTDNDPEKNKHEKEDVQILRDSFLGK